MPGRKSKVAGTNFESRVVALLKEARFDARRTMSSTQSRREILYDIDVAAPRLRLECRFAGHRRNARSVRIDLSDVEDAEAKGADFLVVNGTTGPLIVAPLIAAVRTIGRLQSQLEAAR